MQETPLSIETAPPVLTVTELGQVLRVGRNTAYKYVRSGAVRYVQVGRQIRIPRSAVIEFLEGMRSA